MDQEQNDPVVGSPPDLDSRCARGGSYHIDGCSGQGGDTSTGTAGAGLEALQERQRASGSSIFEALYREWRASVWAAARALLPCDADADDAVQRVFLRLLQNDVRPPPRGWTEAYFRTAGRNEARMEMRAKIARVSPLEPAAAHLPTQVILPDRMLHVEQVHAFLRDLIAEEGLVGSTG